MRAEFGSMILLTMMIMMIVLRTIESVLQTQAHNIIFFPFNHLLPELFPMLGVALVYR